MNQNNHFVLQFSNRINKEVYSDKNRICQVLLNLLTNANKFTKDGTITVFCSTSRSSKQLIIKVKDEGIGIKEEDRNKLFLPFENMQNGSDMNPFGTGMGLSICHSMLDAIDCMIQLESTSVQRPYNGSVFTFTMHNDPVKAQAYSKQFKNMRK
jgi:anti-sigma regulatory factor (Ser/Thr protein kinase)